VDRCRWRLARSAKKAGSSSTWLAMIQRKAHVMGYFSAITAVAEKQET
jgi:hypothetical protein